MAAADLRTTVKTHNKLLSLLLIHGPMLRIHMAEWLGITTSAVTYRTGDLMQAGLIQEVGECNAQTGPGRKSQLVDITPNGAYAVGVHRTRNDVEIGLVNLKGHVVASRQWDVSPAETDNAELTMMAVATAISNLLAEAGVPMQKVLGIGIATVGAADAHKGVEYHYQIESGHITPVPVPTAAVLSRYFPVPIAMATKARAMASGERWFGSKCKSFLLVHVHHGVGSAVVLGGYLYNGQGHAGTLGHIKVASGGPPCSCGEQGCVEALVNRHALLTHINKYQKLNSLYEAAAFANAGDQHITSVFTDAAKVVAAACAPVVDALEPEAVVLVGPMFEVPEVLRVIKGYLDAHTFVGRLHQVTVLPSSFGKTAGVVGAASLSVSSLLQDRQTPDWPPAEREG